MSDSPTRKTVAIINLINVVVTGGKYRYTVFSQIYENPQNTIAMVRNVYAGRLFFFMDRAAVLVGNILCIL
jgi:hypothetical protein